MSSQKIDLLNNWHTVSAVTYTKMNEAIKKSGKTPDDFEYKGKSGSIKGTFGDWELTTGGGGNECEMTLAITGGTITVIYKGTSFPEPIPDNCVATVEVKFGFSKQEAGSTKSKLDTITEIKVEEITPSTNDDIADSLFKKYLGEYLDKNHHLFVNVFATVDFQPTYKNQGLSWLTPVQSSYAVAEYDKKWATLDNSVFGIMQLIDGDGTTPTVSQINRNVIPDGRDAAFLISTPKFLEHMILGILPHMFKDIKKDDAKSHFKIDDEDSSVSNKGTLNMEPVTLDNGKEVTPSVGKGDFKIQILNTTMKITGTDMNFEVEKGIRAYLSYELTCGLKLDAKNRQIDLDDQTMNETGGGRIELTEERKTLEKAMMWTGLALSVVGSFGGVIAKTGKNVAKAKTVTMAGGKAKGASSIKNQILGKMARALFKGTPEHVSKIASRWAAVSTCIGILALGFDIATFALKMADAKANNDYTGVPQIDELTDSAFDKYVTFPKPINNFTLKSIGLNNSLQFGLDVSN